MINKNELKKEGESGMNQEYEVIQFGNVKFTLKYCTAVPEASEAEDEELLQDISVRGFLTPVFIDEQINVIDGRRKLKIAKKLGRNDFTTKLLPGLSEAEKWQLAQDLNFHRRQLTKAEIDQIIQRNREKIPELALSLRVEGKSYRMIGDKLGVSPETARKAVNQAATVHQKTVDLPETICGKDGKKRSAKRRPTTIYAATPKEVERAIKACQTIGDHLPNGNITVKRAERIARETERERLREQDVEDFKDGQVELLQGEFTIRGQEIPDSTIDLICTDPPYDQASLSLWDQLGALAARILKPSGVLISYSGTMYLNQIYPMLDHHLHYLWTATIYHTGGRNKIHPVGLNTAWKPILIYYKPPLHIFWPTITDMVSGGESKEHHDWEQSIGEALHYIKAFCPRNGVLLDPMMGSGTSIIAGLESGLGFRCIGIEIDKAAFSTAQTRIERTLDEIKDKKESA
jgi:ParB-like chromosome segregation protein Spo0J